MTARGAVAASWRVVAATSCAALLAACGDRGPPPGPSVERPSFDGEAALELVRTQVAFGPRVPGSPGHAAQLDWMLARLDSLAPGVVADTFGYTTTYGDSLTLVNVRARFAPERARRILLLAHWDTRPTSDQAAEELHDTPVPGANDGGSGVAVLLEVARHLAASPPPVGVDLLFVDGEDYGPGTEDMFIGARRYAARLPDEGRPVYGVLLDMVGDSDPEFPMEGHSVDRALPVVRRVWRLAERLGYGDVFTDRTIPPIGDDHVPLNDAGLPTIDVIDLEYGPGRRWWHTPEDTPDKLSAGTLRMVGEVVLELVYTGG